MYHPSHLTPKTILKIQTAQRSVELPRKAHLEAIVKAHLYRAATIESDPEAKEQLRILLAITPEAQDAYFSA